MTLLVILVVAAVLVWPARPGRWEPPRGAPLSLSAGAADPRHAPAGGAGQAGRPGAGEPGTVHDVADALDLCALALRAGLGTTEALEAVAGVLHGEVRRDLEVVAAARRWGLSGEQAWAHVAPVWRPAALAWLAAERAGAAPAALVAEAAARIRAAEDTRVEGAVQRAAVLLVLPLGLCFLPGFVLTTVGPVVLRLVGPLLGG